MKNILKSSLAATGLSIALLAPALSFAQPPEGPRGHRGGMIERMAEQLDLSDEQRASIKQIMDSSRAEGEADRERLMTLKSGLREDEDDFNAGEVQAAADEIGEITSRMTYRMAETQAQVRAVLTEEQRAELDEWAEKRKERGRKFRDRHGAPDEE